MWKSIEEYIYCNLYKSLYDDLKEEGGYAFVHCHGKDKGKIIHTFPTKEEAMAQHKAIQITKKRRGKVKI
ncbi:MAG: hypothetical protein WA120_07660 [Candidatus Hydromicrobium sp.]